MTASAWPISAPAMSVPSSSTAPAAAPVGGSFRVVTTSLVPVGGAEYADGTTLVTATSPTAITLTFSGNINQNSINATDLVLSGTAVNPSSPVHATSLTWIDGDTVQFNLSGQLNLPGTLDVAVQPGTIASTTGQSNLGYSDKVVIQIGTPPATREPDADADAGLSDDHSDLSDTDDHSGVSDA